MAAILRVKRRHDDEPLEALVIACKRLKPGEKDEEVQAVLPTPLKTVLKFAGTVKNQEDNVVEHIAKSLGKEELKSNFKQHAVDAVKKSRQTAKLASAENRYKVVNCHRALDTSNVEELEDKVMTLIDVEDSVSCAAKTESNSKEDHSYVYDLYYAETSGDMHIDENVFIHGVDQELVYDSYRTGYEENECESEDSNSESNWRNDYPDSDHSVDSINDNDMHEAVQNMKLDNSKSDLSSEEDFVYAVDECDVENFGFKYAKYKAKIKKDLGEETSESSVSSESSEYCSPEETSDKESDND